MKNKIVLIIYLLFLGLGIFTVIKTSSMEESTTYNDYFDDVQLSNPFFEDIFTKLEHPTDSNFNPFYESFPKTTNTSNFQSLNTQSYANINGKTVTVDSYYRKSGEPLNNPNVGVGLMLYQCIQYKMANPTEDVEIYFATYRLSVSAAVCVDKESRFYGYMRSIHNGNYDEYGFVRISYMFVEAAKIGIKVKIVGQLDAYGLHQYSATASKKHAYVQDFSYVSYFNSARKQKCYDKYAEGKTVGDFLVFKRANWDIEYSGGTDMMHNKVCAVSHYLDSAGVEHGPAVWYGSVNLDGISYKGLNGNNGTQSAVIISDHDIIFNVTKNFINLMYNNNELDQLADFRKNYNIAVNNQINLINNGKMDEIPLNELLVYLGTSEDKIFELYFTPLASNIDTWDIIRNPYSKYINKLLSSTSYIEFSFNNPNFTSFYISKVIEDILAERFYNYKHPNNKIFLHLDGYTGNNFTDLKVGTEVGKVYVNKNMSTYMHAKDIILSYEEDNIRHYISIITSCNFHSGALHQQTNQILIIHEQNNYDNSFYKAFGKEWTCNVIK